MIKDNPEEKLTSSMDFSAIMGEEDIIEYYIKSLTLLVKIYSKMGRTRKTDEDKERESKYYSEETVNVNRPENEDEMNGENKVMTEFSIQLTEIFTKLPELSQIVKKTQTRVTPFSSGQNVKPITLCKYEFFELMYNCLLLSKEFPESFVFDTEKINIFSIIEVIFMLLAEIFAGEQVE